MTTRRLVTIFVLIGLLITSQPIHAMPIGDPLIETAPAAPQATTYYVDAVNGSNTTGNGSAAAPWKTITYALSQAVTGDTVAIAAGLYDTALGETFPLTLKPDQTLLGSGRDLTILSGTSSNSVVSIGDGASNFSAATRVSDLTLQNGSAGLSIYSTQGHIAAPIITNVRAKSNNVGISMSTSDVYQNGATVSPLISNTETIANSQHGIYVASYGYFSAANIAPEIVNCLVANNGSHGINLGASAVGANGTSTNPRIVNTRIQNNGGHGIWSSGRYQGWVNPHIERSWINNNAGYGFVWEQGINRGNISAAITNTMIGRNQSGGIYLGDIGSYQGGGGSLRLVNVTIAENASYGIYWSNANGRVQPDVVNSIIWNTAADDLFATTSTPWSTAEVRYSDIQDGDLNGQQGNLSIDPGFADAAHGDFHLQPTSPVLDSGNNTALLPLTDIDGDARRLGSAVAMGADETQPYQVAISKSEYPTDTVHLNATVTYTLTLTNSSTASAGGVLVTDTLPAEISWNDVLQASVGYATISNGILRWAGTLPAASAQTISYSAIVKSNLPVGTIITNTATIDDRMGGITTTLPVTLAVRPTVLWNTSTQTVDATSARPGQRIMYTVSARNTGNAPAYQAIVTDTLDSHVTFAAADAGGVWDTDRVVWNGLTVTNGAAIMLTVAVTINTPLSDTTPIMNQANMSGGQASFTLPTVTTTVYNPPLSDFDAAPTLGAVPVNVIFTNHSQHATTYLWTYGDGTSSTMNGTHQYIYYAAGFYTVTLRVSNPVGSSILTRTNYITAYNAANAYFSGSPVAGLGPLTVTFTNSSANATQFAWDYGDGMTSAVTTPVHTHQYAAPGFYTVTLTAIGSYNQHSYTRASYIGVYEPPSANFTAAPRTGVSPLPVNFTNYSTNSSSYRWNFGDGSISYAVNPSHFYFESGTYTVTLTAYNPGGEDALTRSAYITVYAPPVANFSGTPTLGQTPLTVTFANSSVDADTYLWEYGNGQTSTTTAITHTHTYTSSGTYTVKLTAFNVHGQHALTRSNYIAAYAAPQADFAANPVTGTSPLSVTFANLSQNAATYLWDFGDGSTAAETNPVHVYAAGGIYTTSLWVGNPAGSAVLTRTNYITVNQGPISDFTAVPRIGTKPLPVTFTNTSQFANVYLWNYGDGITSTIAALTHSHVYAQPGIYTVTLTALGLFGNSQLVKQNHVVVHHPLSGLVYYIDARYGDNMTGDGSNSAPWKTVAYALDQVTGPNTTLYLTPGTYHLGSGEVFPLTMKQGVSLLGAGYTTTAISGVSSQHVLYFPGTAFSASTQISGLKITSGDAAIRIEGSSGPGSRPTIRANWLTGNNHGIYASGWSENSRSSALIEDNLITQNAYHGIYDNPTAGAQITPIIRNNRITNNGNDGILCSTGGCCYSSCDAQISNNVISGNGRWGINHISSDWFKPITATLYNNLIAHNASGGVHLFNEDTAIFLNNTVVNNNTFGIQGWNYSVANCIVWNHNDDLTAPVGNVSYSDVSEIEYTAGHGNLFANPQFITPALGDYHLLSISPVIDAGDSTVSDLPATDLDGNSRIMGLAVDMGAYEVPIGLAGSIGIAPNPIAAGWPITFNLQITNTGIITLHTIITDVLSTHVMPTNPLTWTATIMPGSVWSRAITATVVPGYEGSITNTLQVTSLEGPSGFFTATAQALIPVSGLSAVNNGPTALGQPTVLTATITGGSVVTYTWSLGDMTTDFGAVIAHTYPSTGTYTAIITATNSVSVMTATTTVLITPVPLTPRAYLPIISHGEP